MAFFQDTNSWVLISFLIFAAVAFRFGRGAMLGKLDTRIEQIRRDLKNAETLRLEAQDLFAKYEVRQREAATEAERIIEAAKKNALEIGRQAEKELEETMERREKQLAERLKRMEESAMQEIRSYAAALAVKAAAGIIAEKMDQSANANLVEKSIAGIASGRLT